MFECHADTDKQEHFSFRMCGWLPAIVSSYQFSDLLGRCIPRIEKKTN